MFARSVLYWLQLNTWLSTDSLLTSTDFLTLYWLFIGSLLTSTDFLTLYWLSSDFYWLQLTFWLFTDFYWLELTFWLSTDTLLTSSDFNWLSDSLLTLYWLSTESLVERLYWFYTTDCLKHLKLKNIRWSIASIVALKKIEECTPFQWRCSAFVLVPPLFLMCLHCTSTLWSE